MTAIDYIKELVNEREKLKDEIKDLNRKIAELEAELKAQKGE